ncbi:MAG: hypothetical protein GY694_19085, partial [Gammaproteobacteria bacterium]|nr:hypothetical protein [Gammaproteobacteria bacterium]
NTLPFYPKLPLLCLLNRLMMDPGTLNNNSRPYFNSFRRIQTKFIRAYLHVYFLNLYTHFNIIPNHLQLNIHISTNDDTFERSWKQKLTSHSLELLKTLLEEYKKYCGRLGSELHKQFQQLTVHLDPLQLPKVIEKLKSYAVYTWTQTKKPKIKKLTSELKRRQIFNFEFPELSISNSVLFDVYLHKSDMFRENNSRVSDVNINKLDAPIHGSTRPPYYNSNSHSSPSSILSYSSLSPFSRPFEPSLKNQELQIQDSIQDTTLPSDFTFHELEYTREQTSQTSVNQTQTPVNNTLTRQSSTQDATLSSDFTFHELENTMEQTSQTSVNQTQTPVNNTLTRQSSIQDTTLSYDFTFHELESTIQQTLNSSQAIVKHISNSTLTTPQTHVKSLSDPILNTSQTYIKQACMNTQNNNNHNESSKMSNKTRRFSKRNKLKNRRARTKQKYYKATNSDKQKTTIINLSKH